MASISKVKGKRGIRWGARVRYKGIEDYETFGSKAAAEAWGRAREHAIDTGEFRPAVKGTDIFADVIDAFVAHRKAIRRAPGATFANALARLKRDLGLESLAALNVAFWRQYALDRIAEDNVEGSTVASEVIYAMSVLRFARSKGKAVDATAPGLARSILREQDGIRVVSKQRTRRITDAEITALLDWFDANKGRTSLPMRDLVEFALASAMRRGEIIALQRSDITGRVARIKRKHPRERDRFEDVPLLQKHEKWPRVDPLEIIERQPNVGERIFPFLGDTISYWLEQACEAREIKNVSFHVLRHECLSRLAERGFDPLRLALVAGHRDLRNVKRYAKLDPAKVAIE